MDEAIKDRQSTDKQASKQADADIVLALRPESRPTEIAPGGAMISTMFLEIV